jgi:hypothetical protein
VKNLQTENKKEINEYNEESRNKCNRVQKNHGLNNFTLQWDTEFFSTFTFTAPKRPIMHIRWHSTHVPLQSVPFTKQRVIQAVQSSAHSLHLTALVANVV